MKKECPLCNSQAKLFYKDKQTYFKCDNCFGIFVDTLELPDSKVEKERYELHNDDVNNDGYRNFVAPLTSAIINDFTIEHKGLDFGAGTSRIISSILKESNYNILDYDPYFHIHPELLEKKYDYLSSCEVVEHFYTPYKEFKLLKSLLNTDGKLYIMTEPYHSEIDFATWYYKNDPTHVFFYSLETLQWIKNEFGFSSLDIKKRLVVFNN